MQVVSVTGGSLSLPLGGRADLCRPPQTPGRPSSGPRSPGGGSSGRLRRGGQAAAWWIRLSAMPRGRGESPGACETGTIPPLPRLPRTPPRPHAAPSLIPVHLIMTSSSQPRDPGAETQAWGRSTDNAPQSRVPRSLTRRPRFLPNAPTPHRPWRLPLLRAGPLGPHGLPKPCPRGRDGGKRTVPSSPALGTQPTCPRLPGRKETGGGASSRLPASSEHQPLRGHCAAPTPPDRLVTQSCGGS